MKLMEKSGNGPKCLYKRLVGVSPNGEATKTLRVIVSKTRYENLAEKAPTGTKDGRFVPG